MSEQYAGRQIVGMDLHRRRSVLVRMTDTGEHLETVRISNDPQYLKAVMARAGEAPEVVLEACGCRQLCRTPEQHLAWVDPQHRRPWLAHHDRSPWPCDSRT